MFFLSLINFFFICSPASLEEMNKKNLISSKYNWNFISDSVMGGVSFGEKTFVSDGNISFLRITGYVSLENNGGFIQARYKMINKVNSATGLKIRARGNNKKYRIHIRTKYTLLPWQYYSSSFQTTDTWQNIDLKLESFLRSGSLLPKRIVSKDISSIAIVAYGEEYRVKIDVSELEFY